MSLMLEGGCPAAVIATDICLDLACGVEEAARFFAAPPVEPRLSTATYLELLERCRTAEEVARWQRFVRTAVVLSLGPMASGGAVRLVQAHGVADGLAAMQALTAATALAHELPLVTRSPAPYRNIEGLELITPYGV